MLLDSLFSIAITLGEFCITDTMLRIANFSATYNKAIVAQMIRNLSSVAALQGRHRLIEVEPFRHHIERRPRSTETSVQYGPRNLSSNLDACGSSQTKLPSLYEVLDLILQRSHRGKHANPSS